MAKDAPSPHEVRLASLNTNPVFQSLREKVLIGMFVYKEVMSKYIIISSSSMGVILM